MSRKILTIISGLAILVAHLHCAVGHGSAPHVCQADASGTGAVLADGGALPISSGGDSHDCDRDFGCICKGATLGICFVWIDSPVFEFLDQSPRVEPFWLHPELVVSCEFPFWQTPREMTALQICAHFQSFQL